jgi:hypothetical protein
MKLKQLLFGIIVALLFYSHAAPKEMEMSSNFRAEGRKIDKRSFYEQKQELLNLIMNLNNSYQVKVEKNTVLQVIGVTSIIGFIASVTIFREELFSTIPLSLLGIGILFIILGT